MTSARRWLLGALTGLLAGAAAVLGGEAVSRALSGTVSPIFAVGNRVVDWTPQPLKDWAIAHFGSHDKDILVGSVIVVVAVIAALIGVLGTRRPRLATGCYVVLALVAWAAVLTDRTSTAGTLLLCLPALTVLVVGVIAYRWLWRGLDRAHATRRPERSEAVRTAPPEGFDRRAFLEAAAAVAAVAAAGGIARAAVGGSGAATTRAGVRIPRPSVRARSVKPGIDVPGITPYITPNRNFYRVDTALQVPQVEDLESWRLRIHGMVDHPLELSFADLLDRRLVEEHITLTCVSNQVGGNLVGNATWIGVPTRDLLAEAGARSGADAVKSTSVDGFTASTPLHTMTDDRGTLVAVAMNGAPLPLAHGFPARMVNPGLYGYVSATKWLTDLEVTRFSDFKAYWTNRGYAAQAPIKLSSRIDVPRAFAHVRAGRTPVAGVAWSQHRGITKVEVSVDDGPWQAAHLSEQDDINTWRQWVWHWDATPGNHTLSVRATDATGTTQTATRAPVAPDGSTGRQTLAVTVS
ncbi:MAG: molybdopterin-dependent oxidoreductase [Marmoricola sp.]